MSSPTAASQSSAEPGAARARTTARRFVVEAWRGTGVESRHEVWCAFVPGLERGASTVPLAALPAPFMRSAAKPFQLLPLLLAGGAERFALDDADVAVMCASHDGTDLHAQRVAAILKRMGLGPAALGCGIHRPYFLEKLPAESPERWRVFDALHNNCSGNHAGMLGLALLHGVDPARYLDPGSRSQQLASSVVAALSGVEPVLATDDCSAPCYAMPLDAMAEAYRFLAHPSAVRQLPAARRARFATLGDLDRVEQALERISSAMASEPAWLSGDTTGATRFARALPGQIVAKHGAEGVLCVAHRGRNAALAFKVADGNSRALMPALLAAVDLVGWLSPTLRNALADLVEPPLVGRVGQRVGQLRVVPA